MSADIERWDPPNDSAAFESLCLDLWRDIWQDHAQKNGRAGQPQAGIDIFGQHQGRWMGVQCKQKDGLLLRRVSVAELDQEVEAATQFTPPLSSFILATTGPRDAALQRRAREVTEAHRSQGLFTVEIWSWDDIWRELYGREQLFRKIAPLYWPRAEALRRLAPPQPSFDLALYQKILNEQYGRLKLESIADDWNKYTLSLRSVYIPQKVKEALPTREFTRDYLRASDERRLHFDQLTEDEARRREHLKRQDKEYVVTPSRPLMELVDDPACSRMVILGDPGLGKTTLLQYLALRWAENGQGPIPFLIELPRYASDPGGCRDFVEYLERGRWTPCRFGNIELTEYFRAATSLVLFDGLDELVDRAQRAMVVGEIIRFAAEHPLARVMVTTRVVGYHPGSKHPESFRNAGFRQFTLQDFDEEEIEKFITAWHRTAFPADNEERQLFERRLRRAVRESSAIRELAQNPLLLTIMAILSRKQDLPRERPRLYHKCGELLLHDWETDKFLDARDKIGPDEKWLMLRRVALAMQAEETGLAGNVILGDRLKAILVDQLRELDVTEPREIARDLIQKFHERNFMLSFLGDDWYAFVHRTFLEYLCALEYQWRFEKTSGFTLDDLHALFTKRWRQSEWHEILRLICGLIGTEYAVHMVEKLLEQKAQTDGWQAVFLAADCLSEIRGIDAVRALRDTVLRDLKMVAIFDMPYSYRIAQGAPALADIMSGAITRIARGWKDDNTFKWLLDRAVRVSWPARYTVVQELSAARKEDPEMLGWLKQRALQDSHHSVRQVATQEVVRTWKEHPGTLPWLLERARDNDPNLRYVAVQELAKGWHDDIAREAVQEATSDKNETVREAAVTALARYFSEHRCTPAVLKDRARWDRNWHVREAAIEALARFWGADPEVRNIMQENNWWTRKQYLLQARKAT